MNWNRALWISLFAGVVGMEAGVQWRLSEGVLTEPPADAEATEDGALVSAELAGVPVFPVPFAVEAGTVVEVRLQVEAVKLEADVGAEGQAGVVLSMLPATSKSNSNPDAVHRQIVIVGSEAERIRYAFRSAKQYGPGELLLVPTLSYFGRTLRLSEVAFTAHGANTDPQALGAVVASYAGQSADAAWRGEAARRIERHRKADLRVRVTDRLGNPVPEARIAVEQLRHAYPFGTAVVASRLVDAPIRFDPERHPDVEAARKQFLQDNARYREELLRNFNTVVTENDLKWPQWAGANPDVRRQEWTLEALEWLEKQDFTTKGHTMVWGSWRFTPEWLRELETDPEAVQRAVLAHIRDIGHATADRVQYWDVLNEPMSHRNVIELLGMEAVADWFKEARAALPGVRLVMNEFDIVGNGGSPRRRAEFLEFYRELVELGAPIDVIGLQSHFWSDRFTAPEKVWEIIDEVHGATGLPLMVSEFDTNVPNEALQADYTRDFLTAWFAHPATEAFIMWGFWGGAHWMGDTGAMFLRDWSAKPNLAAYRDLVYGDWWTREKLEAGESGQAQLRAFMGRHRISVSDEDGRSVVREIDLGKDGRSVQVILH